MFLSQVKHVYQLLDVHVAMLRKTGLLFWHDDADDDGEIALYQVLLLDVYDWDTASPLYCFVIFDAVRNIVDTIRIRGSAPQFIWIPDDDNGR